MNINNKASTAAGIGALISATVASVCCLGPIVMAALGLGGLGFAAGITKYRPLFLTMTACILGTGFYLAYSKRGAACDDGNCEVKSGGRKTKILLWIAAVAVLGLATFPNWSFLLTKNSAQSCEEGSCKTP